MFLIYILTQLTTLMLVWSVEFSCWLILEGVVFFVAGYPVHVLGKAYIMMVAICHHMSM
jgi:hypothetical protein